MTKNTSQNNTSKEVQINWILNKLKQGKHREDFIQEFSKVFSLTERTADNRLKEARSRFALILEAQKEENDLKLKTDPEWLKTQDNLLKTKKLIYDSLSYIILNRQKVVKINGTEKVVLDIDLKEAPHLKTLWEMNLIGLGEPTTHVKNDNNNKFVGDASLQETINSLSEVLKNWQAASKSKE